MDGPENGRGPLASWLARWQAQLFFPLMLLRSAPSSLLGASAMSTAFAAGVLFLWASRPRALPLALGLVFLLHPIDVFGWKFRLVFAAAVIALCVGAVVCIAAASANLSFPPWMSGS